MPLPKAKLTMEHVHGNFKEFNFLIFTDMGTIDTSDYTKIIKDDNQTLIGGAGFTKYTLLKLEPNSANIQGKGTGFGNDLDTGKPASSSLHYKIKKQVVLYDNKLGTSTSGTIFGTNTIQRIQVKSKRNFLLNQEDKTFIQTL